MIKAVCDICGKEMPSETFAKLIKDYNFRISSNGRVWDICNKCRERLNKWINERRTENEPRESEA